MKCGIVIDGHSKVTIKAYIHVTRHGYIAQWLERLTADQQVPGSNPGVPSSFLYARALNCWSAITVQGLIGDVLAKRTRNSCTSAI